MEQPSYYAVIPAKVRYDKELKASEKLLYAEISALMKKDGVCWASNSYFANLYDTSKETVSRWLKHLKEKGYIKMQLFYKDGTKEVEKRVICIDYTVNTPIDENVKPPIDENVKENNTSINNNNIYVQNDLDDTVESSTRSIKKNNDELLANFNLIWTEYPLKRGKDDAFKHYKAWLRGKKYAGETIKLSNKQMWYAVVDYADYVKRENIETKYMKMGSSFFNSAILDYVKPEEELD